MKPAPKESRDPLPMPDLTAEILWVARYHYLKGQRLLVHHHPGFHQCFLVLQGQGNFQLGKGRFPMKPGDLFLATAGTDHGFETSGRKAVHTLEVKFTAEPGLPANLVAVGHSPFHDRTGAWRSHLEFILDEALSRRPHRDALANLRFTELLLGLDRSTLAGAPVAPGVGENRSRSAPLDPRIRQVLEVIEAGYDRPLTVADIAGALGWSVRQVSGRFKEVTGETVMEALWRVRLERAMDLMVGETASLESIAHRCGFETVQHFNRLFKAREGFPPGRWRKREKRRIGDGVNFGRFVNRTPGQPSLVR